MAFPTGWNRKCAVTIDADEVAGALTDFPVMLTEDCLPSEMFDADGSYPAQNGGGDLRFSSDEAGTTQLPCEVVSFVTDNDPANGTAQIHVQVSSVSSSVDTTIYVWYNTAGTESQPAADSTYGSENVWDSNFVGVWHLEEDPSGSAPQMLDSTANDHHGTSGGSMTGGDSVSGGVGNGLDFDDSNDYVDVGSPTYSSTKTWEAVISHSAVGSDEDKDIFAFGDSNGLSGAAQLYLAVSTGKLNYGEYAGGYNRVESTADVDDGSNHHVAITKNGSDSVQLYIDGSGDGSGTISRSPIGMDSRRIGSLAFNNSGGHNFFGGVISEVRIHDTDRSAAWIAATHSTLLTPDTFASAGTPESPPVANTGAALLMQMIGQ